MSTKWNEFTLEVSQFLESLQVNFRSGENIGEQLDSLDRLNMVNFCESILNIDLTEILLNKDAWTNFDNFLAEIQMKVLHDLV
jgi:hypothetical protein